MKFVYVYVTLPTHFRVCGSSRVRPWARVH